MDDIKRPRKSKLQAETKPDPIDDSVPEYSAAESRTVELKTDEPDHTIEKPEPIFKTPESIADAEIAAAASTSEDDEEAAGKVDANKPTKNRRIDLHMPRGKKQWIIASIIAIIVLGSMGASAYWFVIKKPVKPAPVVARLVKKVVKPKPTTEVSKLSGLIVPIGTNLGPVTAVQIENSPDARPQSGLKEASVIFEAIAEGGITRFNAIFQDTTPDYVGPVRSLRPYYIDWFWPFDASIAHVGGAPQALADIKLLGLKDLDQFYNGGSYDRITSRYAPHNVYTSIARLNDLEKAKGFTAATYTGFLRKKETKAVTPTAKAIDLGISSYFYNAHYDYDVATNSYLRSEGGAAHVDLKSNTQLAPKVVVAIVMSRGLDTDGEHTDYVTTGSGHMYVFQDGSVAEGTWSKASRQAQWVFAGDDGKPIAFNPGQTWFSMVDNTGAVTYTP